jgi:hypothetical protein
LEEVDRFQNCCLTTLIETHQGKDLVFPSRIKVEYNLFDAFEVLDLKFGILTHKLNLFYLIFAEKINPFEGIRKAMTKITERQRKLARLTMENSSTQIRRTFSRSELMRKVGYSWATIDRKSAEVFRSPGFRAALGECGCTPEKVAKVFAEALDATQCHKSSNGEQIVTPDHETRLKTVKTLLNTIL